MQRTNVIQLMPNWRQIKILRECMLLSSCVYNMANYEVRQQIINGDNVSGFFALQKSIQVKDDYKRLGRSYGLPRIQVYSETNSARFKLIKNKSQKKVGLPKYMKNRKTNTTLPSYLVMDGSQYSLRGEYAHIPLSQAMRKQHKVGRHFRIKFNGMCKWKGKQARGQIHFKDGNYYLYQSVEVKDPKPKCNNVKAGLDLGIKRLMSVCLSNGEDKVIGSKRFFRQWQYLSNVIAKEQGKLMIDNKKYSSKKLNRLFSKRSKWQENLFDNVVAKLFRFLNRQGIGELIIGDLKNILIENDKGKRLNKMTHNYWSFDVLLKKIQNKAEEFGIAIKLETEEYTSRTCPICYDNSKNNCQDRIFHCTFCGYIDHRDIIGARNIMFKSMYGSLESIHWCETAPFGVSV